MAVIIIRETGFSHWKAAAIPIYPIGCSGQKNYEFVRLKVDISKEGELLFSIDAGADIKSPKGSKLIGTMEYDPEKKVKVKCVDGSPVENHCAVEAKIVFSNS
jgi:hypothetical protein